MTHLMTVQSLLILGWLLLMSNIGWKNIEIKLLSSTCTYMKSQTMMMLYIMEIYRNLKNMVHLFSNKSIISQTQFTVILPLSMDYKIRITKVLFFLAAPIKLKDRIVLQLIWKSWSQIWRKRINIYTLKIHVKIEAYLFKSLNTVQKA